MRTHSPLLAVIFLAASGATNETGWLTYKTIRAMGILAFDNQARV
jgi:formate dehydrogenase major subunit